MTECKSANNRRTDAALREAIDRAVDRSTAKVFAILGVDLCDPESVERFREDLRFSGKVRRLSERGLAALIVAALTAVGYSLIEGFRR